MTRSWKSIGRDGDPWPAWLRALAARCGVYAIRSRGRVLYVGSSRGRLYDTVTRHFQAWRRKKTFWRGMRGTSSKAHDPGVTYERGECEVAVFTCVCGDHLHLESAWIEELSPHDNLVEHPDGLEDAPF